MNSLLLGLLSLKWFFDNIEIFCSHNATHFLKSVINSRLDYNYIIVTIYFLLDLLFIYECVWASAHLPWRTWGQRATCRQAPLHVAPLGCPRVVLILNTIMGGTPYTYLVFPFITVTVSKCQVWVSHRWKADGFEWGVLLSKHNDSVVYSTKVWKDPNSGSGRSSKMIEGETISILPSLSWVSDDYLFVKLFWVFLHIQTLMLLLWLEHDGGTDLSIIIIIKVYLCWHLIKGPASTMEVPTLKHFLRLWAGFWRKEWKSWVGIEI